MVFRKLFGKKKSKDTPAPRTLSFEQVRPWALDTREALSQEILTKGLPHGEEIDGLFDQVESIVTELDAKELEEELIKRLETITITSKKAYCSAMHSLLSKRQRYDPSYPEDVKVYCSGLQETLLHVNRIATSNGKYLAIAFEPEIKEIGRVLKQIAIEANELSELYNKHAPKWDVVTKIDAYTDEYALYDDESRAVSATEADRAANVAMAQVKRARKELDTYSMGAEAHRHLADIARLETMEKEEHEQNLAIYEYLAPVRRMLKKFKNAVDHGDIALPPGEYAMMEQMMDCPVITVTEANAMGICTSLMAHIREGLEKAVVSEKHTRLDKAVSRCNDIENGMMDSMVQDYVDIISQRNALKESLDSYHDPTIESLKQRLCDAESAYATAKAASEEHLAKQASATERRAHIKAEIKRLISEFYNEITLNF